MSDMPEIIERGKGKKTLLIVPMSEMNGFLSKHVERIKPGEKPNNNIWTVMIMHNDKIPPLDFAKNVVIEVLQRINLKHKRTFVDIPHHLFHGLEVREADYEKSNKKKMIWIGPPEKGKFEVRTDQFHTGAIPTKKLLAELKNYEPTSNYEDAFKERCSAINREENIGGVYILRHMYVLKK